MMEYEKDLIKQLPKGTRKIFIDLVDRMTCLESAMARHKVDNERTRTILQQGYDPYPALRLVGK